MSHQRRNATSTPSLTPTPSPGLQTPVLDECLSANRELLDAPESEFDMSAFDALEAEMALICRGLEDLDSAQIPEPDHAPDHDVTTWLTEIENIGRTPVLDPPRDLGPVPPAVTADAHGLGRFDLPVVPESGMSPANVRQGALGDCWLMSTLIAMSNYPRGREALMERLSTREGGHTVTLGEDAIEVDDKLPVDADRRMVYAGRGATEQALWPGVFERAFANRQGGYGELNGSNRGSRGAFNDLLPADLEAESDSLSGLPEHTHDGVWARLQESPMTTISEANHVYAVMSVGEDELVLRDPNSRHEEDALRHVPRSELFGGTYEHATRVGERKPDDGMNWTTGF